MKDRQYHLLPFRFKRFGSKILIINDLGQFHLLSQNEFSDFVHYKIPNGDKTYLDLKSKDFLCQDYSSSIIDMYATKLRTKKRFIFDSTALHMFVVTHRCNQSCSYCHASSCSEDVSNTQDMSCDIAKACVDLAFESPSRDIKFEFQGGEPLLNFNTIQYITSYAQQLNSKYKKNIQFVLCSNLRVVHPEQIDFLKHNNIQISTSLDGPQRAHDAARKTPSGSGTYLDITANIEKIRKSLGHDSVSALLTVTNHNLAMLPNVIDEYIARGFQSIFIRMLNPFGQALENWQDIAYSVDQFIIEYTKALDYIIARNAQGVFIVEEFAANLLTRILTPYCTGFVDLQSPAGIAISGIIYEANGDVFVSDEARMLFKKDGDRQFCLGNATTSSRKQLFSSDRLRKTLENSVIEALPGCCWCAYQPYCGSDPVRNFSQYRDMISFKPKDPFCKKHKAILDYLFGKILSENEIAMDVFWSWVTRRPYSDIVINAEM